MLFHSKVGLPLVAAAALKMLEKWGGGILTSFFNLKVYPTSFMPLFFDNFCRFLGLGDGGKKSP